MTENLDPGTATREALAEEIARLRLQLVERNDAVKFMTRMRDKAEWERDEALNEVEGLRQNVTDVAEDNERLREERDAYGDTLAKIAESRQDEDVLNVSAAVIAKMTLDQGLVHAHMRSQRDGVS